MEDQDQAFIQKFSKVLIGLVVFAIVILGVAWFLNGYNEMSHNPARQQAKLDRLAPVAGVYVGDTGIYDSVCATCHANGVAGAPEMVASAWSGRLDKGTEMLISNAINGIGAMPARGGRADLSDEQIEAAVTHMLDTLE
jgi:cytochrome c5